MYSWHTPVEGSLIQKCKAIIKNILAKRIRQRIPYVICSAMDKDKYCTEFGSAIVYPLETNAPGYTCEDIEENKVEDDSFFRIMIGHSCSTEGDHEATIRELQKCKLPENTRIFLPLNYGDKANGDRIEKVAQDAFGDKAEILRERLPLQEYMKKLWTVDCAIFHTDRQIALGNLIMLLYMKKKIFLKKDSVMWKYFTSRNIPVYDSSSITLEALQSRTDDIEAEKQFSMRVNNQRNQEKEMAEIYKDLEKRISKK